MFTCSITSEKRPIRRNTFSNSNLICFCLPRAGVLQPLQLFSFAPKSNQTNGNTLQNSQISQTASSSQIQRQNMFIYQNLHPPSWIPPCWIIRSQFFSVETEASRKNSREHCFTRELTRNHVHFSDVSYLIIYMCYLPALIGPYWEKLC